MHCGVFWVSRVLHVSCYAFPSLEFAKNRLCLVRTFEAAVHPGAQTVDLNGASIDYLSKYIAMALLSLSTLRSSVRRANLRFFSHLLPHNVFRTMPRLHIEASKSLVWVCMGLWRFRGYLNSSIGDVKTPSLQSLVVSGPLLFRLVTGGWRKY